MLEQIGRNKVDELLDKLTVSDVLPIIVPGLKIRTMEDRDPWYIVSQCKDGDKFLVVIKSWSKYKQIWTYRVKSIYQFMWEMGHLGQIYKKDNTYILKENKDYYK